MRRIMLKVAYDGTAYAGFQVQANALSVQQVLNEALSDWLGEEIKTIGASRTDTGVHARGNVVVFDTESKVPADKFAFALNTWLPEDIKIQGSWEVPSDFHPRFTDTVKTYEYKILNRTFPDPTRRIDALFVYGELDAEAMNEAASYLAGTHDFTSFAAVGYSSKTPVRTIYSSSVKREGEMITFTITGNGFLYNMVRIIAGTLLEVGKGVRKPEEIISILEAKDRQAAGDTAPAHGLTLISIEYPGQF